MATQTSQEIFFGGFSKVFDEQWQIDVKLKAGDSDGNAAISAHKVVLAARSEVFKKMLESDKFKASSGIETVTLSELKQEELEAFVEFIYSNRSVLSAKEKKHVQSLFVAADKYEIPHLRDLCRKELISSLNLPNALDVLELSQNTLDKPLNDAVLTFTTRNIKTIVDSGEFRLFVATNPNLAVEITKAFLNPITNEFEDESDDTVDISESDYDSDDY